jgi:hypothetical protein
MMMMMMMDEWGRMWKKAVMVYFNVGYYPNRLCGPLPHN